MATHLPVSVPPGNINDWLERLRARAGALEEGIGNVIDALDRGTITLPQPVHPPATAGSTHVRRKTGKKERKWTAPTYVRLAETGVMTLVIAPHDKDHCLVSINGGDAVPMPTRRADFLRAIARPDAGSNVIAADEFVPWKCKATLALERGCSLHAIDVTIYRLREQLWDDFKVSPMLVESRDKHVRLRLRLAAWHASL